MHTVELLEHAIALAEQCGFVVRQDWFGGLSAGACEVKGRRWILIDLALNPREQLEGVLDALRATPTPELIPMPPQLRGMLNLRKAA